MNPPGPDSSTFEPFRKTRVVVTGGAGFIGSNLSRALLRAGAAVTVIDNLSTGKKEHLPEGCDLVVGDVRTSPELNEAIARADYVFHLAAQVGNIKSIAFTSEDAESNILGTIRVLQACRGTAVRKLVYSSSSAIFGEARRIPIDEDHPKQPASFYALSKYTGELYALLASGLWSVPAVCLRYFNVYGWPVEDSEYSGVISIFLRALESDRPLRIYGDGEQFRDFVYVNDVVQAILRAALQGRAGGVYNIGSGRKTSIRDLASVLGVVAGVEPRIEYHDFRAGEVRASLADISRASSELGFTPQYGLERGLREMREMLERGSHAT